MNFLEIILFKNCPLSNFMRILILKIINKVTDKTADKNTSIIIYNNVLFLSNKI